MPIEMPSIPDNIIDMNNLNKLNPITLSESIWVKMSKNALKTDVIDGTSKG